MQLSETVAKVIALATAIDDYWDIELPKRHANYPLVSPGEDSGPPPPEEQELSDLLTGLPEDQLYKLVLLAHLGRGGFGTDDLPGHYEDMVERFPTTEEAVAQMLGMGGLGDYLVDGQAKLEKSGTDIDHLMLSPIDARR
ncbi:MAG TPA: DUF3775 domain-containing protein [Pirellulales bacterium]|nr:DUF3775 domain-containing protein [Pirellulales bacterium]